MMFFQSRQAESRDLLNDILIMGHSWLICCTTEDPDDFSTYIFENVTRYDTDGYFANALKNPVFIEYGISRSESGKYPYRIHDSLMVPVTNENMISTLLNSMIKTFDAFVVDDGIIDRTRVWGKLGTEHAEEVVFENE